MLPRFPLHVLTPARKADLSVVLMPASRVVDGVERSNIHALLPEGSTVTYNGADVDCVVTEHGVARLGEGCTYQERFNQVLGLLPLNLQTALVWDVACHVPFLAEEAKKHYGCPTVT